MEKLNGNQHLPFSDKIGLFAKEELEKLLLIRNFENALLDLFTEGKLKGTTHTCIGQEYIPVSLSPLIREDDFILSNHRGHGHYLARFGDAEGLLAEIMGKEGAVCNGVGGSQHIYREEGYLSTGIQGESVPVAAGIAFIIKKAKMVEFRWLILAMGPGEKAAYMRHLIWLDYGGFRWWLLLRITVLPKLPPCNQICRGIYTIGQKHLILIILKYRHLIFMK